MKTPKTLALPFLALVALATAASGCLSAGNYHSARSLEKGTSSTGLTFSMTTYEFDGGSFVMPNLIPELTYHIGITDDVEVGGRVALGSMALEGNMKYRFLQTDTLHLAVAPAVSYNAFLLMTGMGARLPLIATFDLSDNFSLNLAGFGSLTNYKTVDTGSDVDVFDGRLMSGGGALGVEIRGETFAIRPAVEWTRIMHNMKNADSGNFDTFNVLVHLAWVGGQEKKQLNRIEQKLDDSLGN